MGTLRVKLICGTHLVAKDMIGTSDPFCELRVGGQLARSRKIYKSKNPQWNETFTFHIQGNPMTESLLISVFDYDIFTRPEPMGYCLIPLNCLVRGQPNFSVQNLLNVSHGTISIELTALDFGIEPPSHYYYGYNAPCAGQPTTAPAPLCSYPTKITPYHERSSHYHPCLLPDMGMAYQAYPGTPSSCYSTSRRSNYSQQQDQHQQPQYSASTPYPTSTTMSMGGGGGYDTPSTLSPSSPYGSTNSRNPPYPIDLNPGMYPPLK